MSNLREQIKNLTPAQLAALKEKLESRSRQQTVSSVDPTRCVAIIGMACRVPRASNLDAFWRLMRDGQDVISEIPQTRWDVSAFHDPKPQTAHKHVNKHGGFLDDLDNFDAALFNITPAEAAWIDPQQRLLLHTAWEALEHAGILPEKIYGSQTAVYVGTMNQDSEHVQSSYGVKGFGNSVYAGVYESKLAGRLSYLFGVHGPSETVNTACSSALVALHNACNSLRLGQASTALVCGVNAILSPHEDIVLSQMGALSPEGRCKTFDSSANGFVRSEGCGVIVLKRLDHARRDGDRIWGIIRGSSVTHVGRSQGFTSPSGPAQQMTIKQAWSDAGIQPADIDFIETHGTGTSLGDPIEVGALSACIGMPTPERKTILAGSVKANVGHLEGAAGMPSLIKVLLALHHGEVPPQIHLKQTNPYLQLESTRLELPVERTPWPPSAKPRIATVSGFGMYGTNAHVVIQEGEPQVKVGATPPSNMDVLAVSARSEAALRALAFRHFLRLSEHPSRDLASYCASNNSARVNFAHRGAFFGTRTEILDNLRDFARSGTCKVGALATAPEAQGRLIFMFTGQGSQYVGMGRGLYENEPVFRASLDRTSALMEPALRASIIDIMRDPAGDRLENTTYTQPAIFALQIALCEQLAHWGIHPDGVVGHSVGEYAACVVAGVMAFEDAARLILARGALMGQLPTGGGSLAVDIGEAEAQEVLKAYAGRVAIAGVNGPESLVLAGPVADLDAIATKLLADGHRAKRLKVSHAFHSPLMLPMLDEFGIVANRIAYEAPRIPFVSTLTGKLMTAAPDAQYWQQHAAQAVRFYDAMRSLEELGYRHYLEIGATPNLIGMANAFALDECVHLAVMKPKRDESRQIRQAIAYLYVNGFEADWGKLYAGATKSYGELPTYAFEGKVPFPIYNSGAALDADCHPLLGARSHAASHLAVFQSVVNAQNPSYLAGHVVHGNPVMPAAAFVEMMRVAARSVADASNLTNVTLLSACDLSVGRRLQTIVERSLKGDLTISIYGSKAAEGPGAQWTLHATGTVALVQEAESAEELASLQQRMATVVPVAEFYGRLGDMGMTFSRAFQPIVALSTASTDDDELLAEITTTVDVTGYLTHPCLLDGCLHAALSLLGGGDTDDGVPFVPVGIARVTLNAAGTTKLWAHVRLLEQQRDSARCKTTLYDEQGVLVGTFDNLMLKKVERARFLTDESAGQSATLHEISWQKMAPNDRAEQPRAYYLVGSPGDPLLAQVHDLLVAAKSPVAAHPHLEAGLLEDAFKENVQNFAKATGASDVEVVYLSGEAFKLDGELDARAVQELARGFAATTLALSRGLLHLDGISAALAIVTREAVALNRADDHIDALQAMAVGMVRVLGQECPSLSARQVDIGSDLNVQQAAAALLKELRASKFSSGMLEDQIALRSHGRYAPRLKATGRSNAMASLAIRNDATYIVTGGIRGLGLAVAQYFVQKGARSLVLVGRSAPQSNANNAIDAMRATGAQVLVVTCDIGEVSDASQMWERVTRELPPTRGIVHCAGVIRDATLDQQTAETLDEALRPKIAGAWNLHQLSRTSDLDFFVLFSSIASVLGNIGQFNYGAGNAFMDALARERRRLQLPALSINWGPWREAGMAVESVDALRARGLSPLGTQDGLTAFSDAVGSSNKGQVAAASIDWQRYLSRRSKPFPGIIEGFVATFNAKSAPAHSGLLAELSALPDAARRQRLMSFVKEAVRAALGLDASKPLDEEAPLAQLELSSLESVEVRNRLASGLGVSLPATLLFEQPSLTALTTYLLGLVPAAPKVDATGQAAATRTTGQRKRNTIRSTARNEPVAIIGVACRVPGAATTEAFWNMLRDGKDGVKVVPQSRWDNDKYYDPAMESPGKIITRCAAFIDDVDKFDATFFDIGKSEATWMDPQQRIALEATWHALEAAGIPPASLARSTAAVFMGSMGRDYTYLQNRQPHGSVHAGLGTSQSAIAGRIAYFLDLRGPCETLDTACSSSLVAVHHACQALRNGDTNLAIVGGVNTITAPESMAMISDMHAISPEGRCKTFDAAANGYGRGEGCGVVILRRLSDAERDGDPIIAVIQSTIVRHDGRSQGFSASNGAAQREMINDLWSQHDFANARLGYIEAHGTGTPLGDPMELDAIANALTNHVGDERIAVSTVKPNVGHLEGAAGIVGLIKAALILKHREIPPHLNLVNTNPHISLESLPVIVPVERSPYPGEAQVVSVSSFGITGTLAHALLEAMPEKGRVNPRSGDSSLRPVVLSTKNRAAMMELARAMLRYLREHPSARLEDITHTLAHGRQHLPYRAGFLVRSLTELQSGLSAVLADALLPGLVVGASQGSSTIALGFHFHGGEAQNAAFAAEAAERDGTFRAAWKSMGDAYKSVTGTPHDDILTAGTPSAAQRRYVACALQYAAALTLMQGGVQPLTLSGQGAGRWIAACVAGALSPVDLVRCALDPRELDAVAWQSPKSTLLGLPSDADARAWLRAGIDEVIPKDLGEQNLRKSGCGLVVSFGTDSAGHDNDTATYVINLESAAWSAIQSLAVALFVKGVNIAWKALGEGVSGKRIVMTPYPFQRQRYWLEEPQK